jgi:hypothetical protein
MGWASGSALADDVWALFRKHVPAKNRRAVARKLVDMFEGEDCDTMDECERLMKDAGLDKRWEEET